jgi:L-iditol 2-dehydrogenase
MKTIRLYHAHEFRLAEEPRPIPQTGEKLLRVRSVGVCGSDLHWFSQGEIGDARLAQPLILGHEFAGETEDGQRVAVEPSISCGQCELCKQGHPNLCAAVRFAGHGSQDGALREWMAWNENCLFPIPESISDDDGALLEPLGVAIHSVDLGKLRAGMHVGVFGCGPIGLLIIQMARLSGAARIIATDLLPHRLEAARAYGASQAYLAQESDLLDQIMTGAGERGIDVAFEAAGTQPAVDLAFAAVAPGGKVILAGIPDDDRTAFSAGLARRKGLTIKLVRRMKHTYPRAIALVSKGLVDLRSLVTHRFPLEQANQAFQVAERRQGLKVIIHP